MLWFLIGSTAISVGSLVLNLMAFGSSEAFYWQIADIAGSAVFLVLFILARKGRLSGRMTWMLSPAYFAFWLILMAGYSWCVFPIFGDSLLFALGAIAPAVFVTVPPRYFVSLMLSYYGFFCWMQLALRETGEFSDDLLFRLLISGSLAVMIAIFTAWSLYASRLATFRKEEELRAANRAKSDFLATMSHEIRTPMNSVIGYAELLRDMPMETEAKEYVESISSSGRFLLSVINDILDFSKIDAGKVNLRQERVELRAMVERMTRMFHPLASGKGLEFQVAVDEGVPRAVEADVHRLEQVLANLISNAIKFTETGTVRLRVFEEEGKEAAAGHGRHRIGFVVSDTGIGIPPEQLEKLFQPFSQVDAFVARKTQGTGLGLVIACRICALMGGGISVASEPGTGSEFTARIVCRGMTPGTAGLAGTPTAVPGGEDFSALRVLVAEDNAINQRLISAILRRWNINPVLVDSGEAAVDQAQAGTFDLILMDIQMGGIDGFEAARRIRLGGAGSRPMIIAVTAFALADDQERFQTEMDGYLSKPLNLQSLREVLGRTSAAKDIPFSPPAPAAV